MPTTERVEFIHVTKDWICDSWTLVKPICAYILNTTAVVHDDNFERGVLPAVPAAEEVPADPPESVDRHLELRDCLPSYGARSRGLDEGKGKDNAKRQFFRNCLLEFSSWRIRSLHDSLTSFTKTDIRNQKQQMNESLVILPWRPIAQPRHQRRMPPSRSSRRCRTRSTSAPRILQLQASALTWGTNQYIVLRQRNLFVTANMTSRVRELDPGKERGGVVAGGGFRVKAGGVRGDSRRGESCMAGHCCNQLQLETTGFFSLCDNYTL